MKPLWTAKLARGCVRVVVMRAVRHSGSVSAVETISFVEMSVHVGGEEERSHARSSISWPYEMLAGGGTNERMTCESVRLVQASSEDAAPAEHAP